MRWKLFCHLKAFGAAQPSRQQRNISAFKYLCFVKIQLRHLFLHHFYSLHKNYPDQVKMERTSAGCLLQLSCSKPRPPKQVGKGWIQSVFKLWARMEMTQPFWTTCPVFSHPYNIFIMSIWNFPYYDLCPLPLVLSVDIIEKSPALSSLLTLWGIHTPSPAVQPVSSPPQHDFPSINPRYADSSQPPSSPLCLEIIPAPVLRLFQTKYFSQLYKYTRSLVVAHPIDGMSLKQPTISCRSLKNCLVQLGTEITMLLFSLANVSEPIEMLLQL